MCDVMQSTMATFKSLQIICLSKDPLSLIRQIIGSHTLELENWLYLLLPHHFTDFISETSFLSALSSVFEAEYSVILQFYQNDTLHILCDERRFDLSKQPLLLSEVVQFGKAMQVTSSPENLTEVMQSIIPRCRGQDLVFLIKLWRKNLEFSQDITQTVCQCLHPQAYASFLQYPQLLYLVPQIKKGNKVICAPPVKPGHPCSPVTILRSGQVFDVKSLVFMFLPQGTPIQLHIMNGQMYVFDAQRQPIKLPTVISKHKEQWLQWVHREQTEVVLDLWIYQQNLKLWDILYWKKSCITSKPFQERLRILYTIPLFPGLSLPVISVHCGLQVVRHKNSVYGPQTAFAVDNADMISTVSDHSDGEVVPFYDTGTVIIGPEEDEEEKGQIKRRRRIPNLRPKIDTFLQGNMDREALMCMLPSTLHIKTVQKSGHRIEELKDQYLCLRERIAQDIEDELNRLVQGNLSKTTRHA